MAESKNFRFSIATAISSSHRRFGTNMCRRVSEPGSNHSSAFTPIPTC
jgi:hypothetical protein